MKGKMNRYRGRDRGAGGWVGIGYVPIEWSEVVSYRRQRAASPLLSFFLVLFLPSCLLMAPFTFCKYAFDMLLAGNRTEPNHRSNCLYLC